MIDDVATAKLGIVICNRGGQVMWARRFGQHSGNFRKAESANPQSDDYRGV